MRDSSKFRRGSDIRSELSEGQKSKMKEIEKIEKELEKCKVEYKVDLLKEALGEEKMVEMKSMTESEIEEVMKIVVKSEEEMKLMKKVFKVLLRKEERVEMKNRKEESKTEEEEEVIVDENYIISDLQEKC